MVRFRPTLVVVLLFVVVMTAVMLPPAARSQPEKPEPRQSDAEAFLSNNLLRIYINERDSRVWEFQYAPGSWGESNFREQYALYTPTSGIAESPGLVVEQSFVNPGGGAGSVRGVTSSSLFRITRTVTMPPGNARYFQIDYEIANKTGATIQDVRFFQAIDFDIPLTGDHTDDYGWYNSTTDYIGVGDDDYFRNIVVSVPRSDRHSVDFYYTQIYEDWDDGDLSGRNTYGPGDPAVAKQFNFGSMAPNASRNVTFYVWFGDPTATETCITGRVRTASGGFLSGATVMAIHQTTMAEHLATTDAEGNYTLNDLTPGTYSLSVRRAGYTPFTTFKTLGESCANLSPRLRPSESTTLIELAKEHAPDIYQDTDGRGTTSDFITRADFDGNWNGLDNWLNAASAPQPAYVYWDGASSLTHHYLKFYVFYPRDWGELLPLGVESLCTTGGEGQTEPFCHENDMEGFAIAVNRLTGAVDFMVNRRHFYPPDACFWTLLGGAPTKVRADRMAHAVYCVHENDGPDFPGDDGITYRYGGTAEVPQSHTDSEVLYDLIHTNELRAIIGTADGTAAFTSNQRNFLGNDWGENKASTPWALDAYLPPVGDRAATAAYQGDLYADPARLFASLFPDAGISTEYTFNPNLAATVDYDPASGGWAATPAGDASVFLPFGAVDSAATVTLSYDVPPDLPAQDRTSRSGETATLLGRPFVLSATRTGGGAVTAFNAPLQLEVGFSSADLEELAVATEDVHLARWNGNAWQTLPTQADEATELAIAYTDTPGVYALFAGEPRTVVAAPIFLPISLVVPYVPPAIPLLNGDFEQGATGWTEASLLGWRVIVNSNEVEGLPTHSGVWSAWLGGDDNEISLIEQAVTVPPDRPYLTYYHGIGSEDGCGYDFGGVLIDGAVVDVYDLCADSSTSGWVRHVVNLSDYAGQTVALQIRVETDGSLNSNLFVDDVAFSSSAAAVAGGAPVPFRWSTDSPPARPAARAATEVEAVRLLGPRR